MKKVLNVIKNIFVWTIVAIAIGMMIFTIVSVNTFDQNDRAVFGYKAYIVRSDSMKPVFEAGDIVLVKEMRDYSSLEAGDIIAYISQNPDSYGETVTHEIAGVTRTEDGTLGYITRGINTGNEDEGIVTDLFIQGKYVGRLPFVGQFFTFLKTPQGYILCIFIPFLLLILYQGINCIRLFRKYKQEQMEEIRAEQAKIEEERRQAAEMMKELQALKAQMGMATAPETPTEAPATEAPATETENKGE